MNSTDIALPNESKINTVARYQLNSYPQSNVKSNIRLLIKSIRKRKLVRRTKFFWPNGLLATSLEWSHRKEGKGEDLTSLKRYYDNWIKEGASTVNSDYLINGYSLIYIYKITGEDRYLNTLRELINYIKTHKKTEIGSIPYRLSSPNEVLVDSLGMVSPFLCRYGANFEDESSIDLAVKQLTNFLGNGLDKKTYLPYHGYNSLGNYKTGIIGWGRAVGWLLIGLVDSLEYIPSTHKHYEYLHKEFEKIVEHVLIYQKEDGNFTWQITASDGPIDSSSTSMISYAIRRGVMLKLLPEKYKESTNLAKNTLLKNSINGYVQNCSAECKGIGMYPQKYGNYPWGQAPTMSLIAIS